MGVGREGGGRWVGASLGGWMEIELRGVRRGEVGKNTGSNYFFINKCV